MLRGRLLGACLLSAALATAGQAVAARAQTRPATPGVAARFDVFERSIEDLQAALRTGSVTSRTLVEQYLARIRAYDVEGPRLNSMIALNPRALADADALDGERRAGRVRGPLHGIPVVVKDNYATADMPTTGGSLALEGFQTGRDAFQVRKLRDAGAVIIGKTNLHELAYGITTISSMGGQSLNPYDPSRTPGGSSGGTGAAVAATFAAAGMGSDTCGSIRIPSANNNLFGLRGTPGLSSRDGIIPLSHTQDVGGPLARGVADLALMLDATVGADAADPVTGDGQGHIPQSFRKALSDQALTGARLGVLTSLFGTTPEDGEVAAIVRAALERLKAAGAGVVEVTVPGLDQLLQGTSVIGTEFKFDLIDFLAPYRAAPVHSLDDILRGGLYSASVQALYQRANEVEARDTPARREAMAKRDALRARMLAFFKEERLDAVAYPTLRRRPASIGEAQLGSNCQLSPATGFPAIGMPAGFTDDGVPVGFELLGPPWTEQRLLDLAYSYEKAVSPRRAPATTPPLSGR